MPLEAAAIIGSGSEAVSLARILALKGVQVRVFDVFKNDLRIALARIEWTLRRDGRPELIAGIEPVQEPDKLAGADIVIETAGVQAGDRADFLAKAAQSAGENCVFAVRCGAEPVTPFVAGLPAPGRFAGLRIHPPSGGGRLAEVARLETTGDAALKTCRELATSLEASCVIAHDLPGVIVERLRRPFILAALALLESGKGFARDIDEAVRRGGGLPQGPFEMADDIGLDVDVLAGETIHRLLGAPQRLAPSALESRLAQHGHLGKRSTAGFYLYDYGEIIGENPALADLTPYLGISPARPEDVFASVMEKVCAEAKLLASESMVSEFDMETAVKTAFGWPKGPLDFARELEAKPASRPPKQDQWGDAL
ncbi:MAG: 3-hydroxyacyl-CoA dehydrogenase family protein [Elusimicrobiales bacterium]